MKLRNFTGQVPNFVGGFSSFSSTESPSILWFPSTYKFRGKLATGTETAPQSVWLKPDGTKLYVVGATRCRIRSYDLTTAWDINSATNLVEFATVLQNSSGVNLTLCTGISFSNDGTKAYVTDSAASNLNRYNLSIPWDVSTLNATADQTNTTIYTGAIQPQSIWVKSDGLGFLTANSGATSSIKYWTSAIANDITSLTLSATVAAASFPVGANWIDDGNKLIYIKQSTDALDINTYSPAYSFTGGAVLNSTIMTPYDTTPTDIYMKNDGSAFYYIGSATDSIYQFTL